MSKIKIGEDSPIPKYIYVKIRRRDGVESLTTLEEGEFKVPIDGCISSHWNLQQTVTYQDSDNTKRHLYFFLLQYIMKWRTLMMPSTIIYHTLR